MLNRFLLTGLFALAITLQAGAANLASIKRIVLKEPAYDGKPQYVLLAFGAEAKTHIWLVRDGNKLYVDRNANGDLTDAGEMITGNGSYFNIDRLAEADGKVHRSLYIYLMGDEFRMRLGQMREPGNQFVGWGLMDKPRFGDSPASAPIIHFGGPLSLERYGPPVTIPRGDGNNRQFKLRLLVGTPGVGKGTFASYSDTCSRDLGNVLADIVYTRADKHGETFVQRVELLHDG